MKSRGARGNRRHQNLLFCFSLTKGTKKMISLKPLKTDYPRKSSTNSDLAIRIGMVGRNPLDLDYDMISRHVGILGVTGEGKSRLVETMAEQLIDQGQGVAVPDPDGKTVTDLAARLAEKRKRLNALKRYKLFYLKPSPDMAFSYDPFYTTMTGQAYDFWLPCRVASIGRTIGRPVGISDYRDQLRRLRVLMDILFLVGTNDGHGRHHGLSRLDDALDMGNKPWERLYIPVRGRMPRSVAKDLWRLHRMPFRDRQYETESAVNIVTGFLCNGSPMIKEILGQKAPPIDCRYIVKRHCVLLADLSENPYASQEQMNAIAAMLYTDLFDACWYVQEPFFLFAEEIESVLGADLGKILTRARKRKCSLIYSMQSLSCLKDKFTDITDKAIGQPGIIISFRQRTQLDTLAEIFGTRSLDFTLNMRPTVLPAGEEIRIVPEHSRSRSTQTRWGLVLGLSGTHALGGSRQAGMNMGSTETDGTSAGLADGQMSTKSHADMFSHEPGKSRRLASDTDSSGQQTSRVATQGTNHALALSSGFSMTEGENWMRSLARLFSQQTGGGETQQESVTYRHMVFPKHDIRWFPNGLLFSLDMQYAFWKRLVTSLGKQEILISIGNLPTMLCRVRDVPDAFEGKPRWRSYITQKFTRELCRKPCFFVPEGFEKWMPVAK
jgi:hypothetical protein